MDDELLKIRDIAKEAQSMANTASNAISSHEQLCSERYKNIETKLGAFSRLFEKLDTITKVVYTGVGIAITVPIILEALRYLEKH